MTLKRLPAILFLAILLFNFYGYRLMLDCLQDRDRQVFSARLDRNAYSEEDLISIKTPMDLPYYTNSPVYERAYGSVNVKGTVYAYVKRRVYNDTLELLCLPNRYGTDIQSAKNELLSHSLDGTASAPNKKSSHQVKISLPDFCQELQVPADRCGQLAARKFFTLPPVFCGTDYSACPERPPCAITAFS